MPAAEIDPAQLPAVAAALQLNGAEVATNTGANVLGNPLTSLARPPAPLLQLLTWRAPDEQHARQAVLPGFLSPTSASRGSESISCAQTWLANQLSAAGITLAKDAVILSARCSPPLLYRFLRL